MGTGIPQILERAGNHLLKFDPDTLQRISRLRAKVIKLEFLVVGKTLFFIPADEGLYIRDEWAEPVDITLTGSPMAFARFGLRQKGLDNQAFIDKKITIEGDVELAQDFQKLIRQLDIDLEELLSHYVGDVAAHQIGRGAGLFAHWARQAAESLRLDIREYLEEEARVLAPEWRVTGFMERVDSLRTDVERLDQRVDRLIAHIG
ncbi:SCP2 sterol-binding domain-containing protein [Gammaproteobacteria bacterium]|nr:SCP2 sterol-binding domain-containing protein [Gammaproteobacteria bacterium]